MAESDWEDVPNDNESDWVDAEEAQSSEMPVGEGLTRSALKALPAVGGTIGGLVGSPVAPPFGAIGGATLGGMAGKSVQSGIEGLLFEDERAKHNYDQIVNDQMTGAMEGVTGEMGGQIISKGLSKIPTVYEALKKGAGKMAETLLVPLLFKHLNLDLVLVDNY